MTSPSGVQCIFCKSRYHDYRRCPMAFRAKRNKMLNQSAKAEYSGQSPNVFVGHYNYPNVNVGFLNVEEYTEQDEPLKWSREERQIPEIIDFRSSLINSTFKNNVRSFSQRLTEMSQEIGMASKPADVEISLAKRPVYRTSFDEHAQPHGPNVPLKQAKLAANVHVDSRVERVVDDVDLKAGAALGKLYTKGFDEHFLTRLLSVGTLGVKTQRKMVPTRWSITATDDTLGKALIGKVKEFRESDCRVHLGGYLGNYYVILFYDALWSYELFEGYLPKMREQGPVWDTDFEGYGGRKGYAENTVGGYYAARLAILEELQRRKRQAAILALRFVTDEYTAPLGVWVVREAVRKAMASPPLSFADRDLMQAYAVQYCRKRFSFDISSTLARSRLLSEQKAQLALGKWL